MAIRLLNRPSINIQTPKSGVDLFFEEVAKYASPEYQLRKKEADAREQQLVKDNERADARLRLNQRQQLNNEERYDNSIKQQTLDNRLRDAKEERDVATFEANQSANNKAIAQESIQNSLTGMSLKDITSTPIEFYTQDIEDPKVRTIVRNQMGKNIDKAKSQYSTIIQRMNDYNNRYPENTMSESQALDVLSDPKLYASHLSQLYLNKVEGDLTPQQQGIIKYNTQLIGSTSKRITDLETQQNTFGASAQITSEIEEQKANIDKYQKGIEDILGISEPEQVDYIDAYGQREAQQTDFLSPLEPTETVAQPSMANLFSPDSPADYGILFAEDDEIAEPALQIAQENAKGDGNVSVLSGGDIDRYDPTSEGLDEDSAVPPAFLQTAVEEGKDEEVKYSDRLLSGLNIAEARPRETVKESLQKLASGTSSQGQRPTRKRERFLTDFGGRLKKLDYQEKRLGKTNIKNTKKRNSINKKIAKLRESIVNDFSKIYDSSEGASSIDPRYFENVPLTGAPMSRNELAKLIRMYQEMNRQPQIFAN